MTEILELQPLEKIALPKSLDGSEGFNRAKVKPLLKAATDLEAIQCWLAEYANKPTTTYSNYRRDAERLLLWAVIERKKPLSSLEAEDLLAYSQFLDDPKPRERWCQSKTRLNRWGSGWKPFMGPLSKNAKVTAFANLTSLFNFLVDMNYLQNNPFKAIRRQIKQTQIRTLNAWQVQERILGMEAWTAILDVVNEMPEEIEIEYKEKIRLRYILALLYFAGLRINELTSHTMAAFKKIYDREQQKDCWWLWITGKGDKSRKIPVNQNLLDVLVEYRMILGLEEMPKTHEVEPLVRSFKTGQAITARRVNQLLKSIGFKASLRFKDKDPEKMKRLQKASAHWYRHLSISMQAFVGMRRQHIKDTAGHSSENITEIYMHSEDNVRHQEMQKLSWRLDIKEKSVI